MSTTTINRTTKAIQWSYPSSPNADRFRFRDGCYTVSMIDFAEDGTRCIPRAMRGFETIEEARAYADSFLLDYDRYTL